MTRIWEQRELLSERHDLSDFRCGEEAIDTWVQQKCARYVAAGMCTAWVCPDEDGRVLGLFTLSTSSIRSTELSSNDRSGFAAMPHPAILLGQIALRDELRGRGLGTLLLLEALAQCVEAALTVGTRFIVLDALNDRLVKYYADFGFKSAKGDPRTMVMSMKTARKRLAEAEALRVASEENPVAPTVAS